MILKLKNDIMISRKIKNFKSKIQNYTSMDHVNSIWTTGNEKYIIEIEYIISEGIRCH